MNSKSSMYVHVPAVYSVYSYAVGQGWVKKPKPAKKIGTFIFCVKLCSSSQSHGDFSLQRSEHLTSLSGSGEQLQIRTRVPNRIRSICCKSDICIQARVKEGYVLTTFLSKRLALN